MFHSTQNYCISQPVFSNYFDDYLIFSLCAAGLLKFAVDNTPR